jgi:hypothetical protein
LVNLSSQIDPGHLVHHRCITKKGNTVLFAQPRP